MKKTFLVVALFVSAIFSSCTVETVALKGNYAAKPYETTSSKTVDAVWSNVIDFFAQKGIAIKIIDKSSGLIVSETTSFAGHYSIEDDNGTLLNPSAWVAVNKMSNGVAKFEPSRVMAGWNVRIKAVDGKTVINVNITNIDASLDTPQGQYAAARHYAFEAKSTGKFEQLIFDAVK